MIMKVENVEKKTYVISKAEIIKKFGIKVGKDQTTLSYYDENFLHINVVDIPKKEE